MAGTSKPRQQPRALAPAPKLTPDTDPSSSSSQPNTSSHLPVFDDLTAVTPVTMPNQPYRDLAQRVDSPHRQLPIEQLVDTRLCVSALTPQQCRDVIMQLDDRQIKNAVYDRTLCFPHDQWTHNIRAIYGQQVEQDTRVVSSFENMTAHMEILFNNWKDVTDFNPVDFDNIDAHVKSYLCPSIDNIGVYGTYSKHNATKINALSALLKIGQIIVAMPILTSERGVAMFEYDALSRAVGNVLCSAPTDAIRRQIFPLEAEAEFLELVKRANVSGLFSGLLQVLAPGAKVVAYTVPQGDLLIAYRSQQDALSRPTPAKKRKLSTPSTPNNPFSRPSSAGPIAMPPLAKAAYSTTASKVKAEDNKHIKQEQPQGTAEGATEHQPAPQAAQQATQDTEGQTQEAEGSPNGGDPGTEGQPGEEGTQQQAGAGTEQGPKATAYDDLLRHIEDAIYRTHSNKDPEEQRMQAPAVTSLIERTASAILKQFQAAAGDCEEKGRPRDVFMASLQDTSWALLWILESCAMNIGGSALSAEVSRTLSRVTLVGALWGAVRLADAAECLQLLNVKDPVSTETFAEKLERIIRQLDESGVLGFGDLRLVLANMRSGLDVPVQPAQSSAPPVDPILK